MNLFEEQLQLEKQSRRLGGERFKRIVLGATKDQAWMRLPSSRSIVREAVGLVSDELTKLIKSKYGFSKGMRNVGVSLMGSIGIDPREASYIALAIVMDSIVLKNSHSDTCFKIGKAIEDQARFLVFKKAYPHWFNKIKTHQQQSRKPSWKIRDVLHNQARKKAGIEWDLWGAKERMKVGAVMVEIIIRQTALVQKSLQTIKGKKFHYLVANEATIAWLEEMNKRHEYLSQIYMPCVLKPNEWSDVIGGGYWSGWLKGVNAVKVKNRRLLPEISESESMDTFYGALNLCQGSSFSLNIPVLKVMKTLKDSDATTQGIPVVRDAQIPPMPQSIEGIRRRDMNESQIKIYQDWAQMAGGIHRSNERQTSKRIQFIRTLMMADQFLKYKEFWFVWQADFRGRLYPCFSFLSPQGPDYSRSLLKSSLGLPLVDDNQVEALAVHGANMYGFDKVSLEERYGWVLANEADIIRVAQDPIGFDWWQEASEPWGFLAFCFEWFGFVKRGKGFISSLFVQTDGSQNGIQHYAALLRHEDTARAVNLIPQDKPEDLYQRVADRVAELIKLENHHYAREWEKSGLLTRKLGKKPTMVYPYGGTLFSTKAYIKDYITQEILDKGKAYPFDGGKLQGTDTFGPASYIGPFVKKAIDEVVVAAAEGMKYFQKVSKKIADEGHHLRWTSPSGFDCLQYYPEYRSKRIKTELYGNTIKMRYTEEQDGRVESPKVRQSTPPNVIHSFDAAHLHLTLKKARELGLTQVNCVHDSYGAVASQAPLLNRILREAFVEMYTEDVLGDWHDQMKSFGVSDLPDPPAYGNLDVSQVKDSDFFFC